MNFIKDLVEGKNSEEAHKQFKRFSKGNFENRAVVELNLGKDLKIKTSFEYSSEFVKFLAETIQGKVQVKGGIITTKDIRQGLGFEIANVKQFAGVKTYEIDTLVSREDLFKVMENFPDAVFCLTFSTDYGSLKTKVKTPKAPKPGKGDDEDVKADYCVFVTKNKELVKDFAFDVKNDFKKLKIVHNFIIEKLVVPKEYENDFDKARIYARRKGKIIRKLDLDGTKSTSEFEFEA